MSTTKGQPEGENGGVQEPEDAVPGGSPLETQIAQVSAEAEELRIFEPISEASDPLSAVLEASGVPEIEKVQPIPEQESAVLFAPTADDVARSIYEGKKRTAGRSPNFGLVPLRCIYNLACTKDRAGHFIERDWSVLSTCQARYLLAQEGSVLGEAGNSARSSAAGLHT